MPQPSTDPLEVGASPNRPPEAMAVTAAPPRVSTVTGVPDIEVAALQLKLKPDGVPKEGPSRVELPSCPLLLSPQARTDPVEVRARAFSKLAEMAVTFVPVGRETGPGLPWSSVVPTPRPPAVLNPQEKTWPSEVRARATLD